MPRVFWALASGIVTGLSAACAAHADDSSASTVAFNIGAASAYEYRGMNQTRNTGEVYASADLSLESTGYLGVWVSNVDFHNGTRLEYDVYGGVRPLIGPVTVDVGFIRYGYTNKPKGPDEDYTEWKVAPSMAVGPATIGLAYFYSGDFFGETGRAAYYEINTSMPLGGSRFSVSGALGRQQVKGPLDYTTWNLGVGYALNSHVGFDLRYWDTDEHGFGDIYKARLVLGVKATFP